MRQKITIFGDSYAASTKTKHYNNQTTWVDMLYDEYYVNTFGKARISNVISKRIKTNVT